MVSRETYIKLRMITLSEIHQNKDNPRIIKDDKFKKLVQSIKDFPKMMELRPIIVDENSIVLGGNMRLQAIKEAGYTEVPDTWIKRDSSLTDAQKQEFIIKDNVGFGEWNWETLANEWDQEDLENWGLDLPVNFGSEDATDDEFKMPDDIETDIVLGDLFEIGQHRLICGDSTNADTVSKLLGGGKPILMVTDPPYGVKYDPTWRHRAGIIDSGRVGKVENDDRVNWAESYSLFTGNVAYVWHGDRHAKEVAQNLEDCGFDIICQIIWNKQQMVFSRGDYHWKHEPCWYAVKKGSKHNYQGDRKQTTVWDIQSILQASKDGSDGNKAQIHGTQKPVECMARPIKNNTFEHESVYDPFGGSGTTMVAGHQLVRKVYMVEIMPTYCQIIIDRMLKLDPTLEIKKNGVKFTENSPTHA